MHPYLYALLLVAADSRSPDQAPAATTVPILCVFVHAFLFLKLRGT